MKPKNEEGYKKSPSSGNAPEEVKPFKKVAKPKYALKYSVGEHNSKHPSMVEYDADEERELHIADIDYYEILPDGTKKTKFTWDEAMEIEKKTNGKWRLPTAAEWTAIVATFGYDGEGNFDGGLFAKRLNLTTDGDGCGNFWSSTANSTSSARYLLFNASYIYPQNNDSKVYGLAVRCVVGKGE